jgi:hypothetical protein
MKVNHSLKKENQMMKMITAEAFSLNSKNLSLKLYSPQMEPPSPTFAPLLLNANLEINALSIIPSGSNMCVFTF